MATWKKLTLAGESARKIDVNLDNVAFIQEHPDHTVITFAGTPHIEVVVRERSEEIIKMVARASVSKATPAR
jgi:hypothetical protein